MKNIFIEDGIAAKVAGLRLSCIECDVKITAKNTDLWKEIEQKIIDLNAELEVAGIKNLPAIEASRKGYKACGKDPARYRLSAEALLRRVLQRKELYQINNVVDALNLVSISTGFSIGGYDAEKINGDVQLGIGAENEPYNGIGRGELNIEFMPVFRDDNGAFGTSTSDSERTCVSDATTRFLMIIVDYGNTGGLENSTEMAIDLLKRFAAAENFETREVGA